MLGNGMVEMAPDVWIEASRLEEHAGDVDWVVLVTPELVRPSPGIETGCSNTPVPLSDASVVVAFEDDGSVAGDGTSDVTLIG